MAKTVTLWKDEKLDKDKVFSGNTFRMHVGDVSKGEGTWQESSQQITVCKDGALSISDWSSEGFIYLYPEQLKHLQKALTIAKKQVSKTKKK